MTPEKAPVENTVPVPKFLEECWEKADPAPSGPLGVRSGNKSEGDEANGPYRQAEPERTLVARVGFIGTAMGKTVERTRGSVGDESEDQWARRVGLDPTKRRTVEDLPGEWREQFEERAAIMEFDGGLERPWAEAMALIDILGQMTGRARGTAPVETRAAPDTAANSDLEWRG